MSLSSGIIRTTLDRTNIMGFFYPIPPYTLLRRVTIQLSSNTSIQPGIWRINFRSITIVAGGINIYLPTSEGLSPDTRFLNPTVKLTVTVPGTARRVITVGSYNDTTSAISVFSGQGDASQGVLKPDIVAPGEDILSYLPGGNQGVLSGTSMASPHVTASAALLMQWGIVNNNDPYMYGDRVKAILLKFANRNSQNLLYPNDVYGYGRLDLDNIPLESGVLVMNFNDEKNKYNPKDEFKHYDKF
jgi:subtilisin family serine protease